MKRVIKYWQQYESDKRSFSSCSTQYEVLPIVVDDSAGAAELESIACFLELDFKGGAVEVSEGRNWRLQITHSLDLKEKKDIDTGLYFKGDIESRPAMLGFISLPEARGIEVHESLGHEFTEENFYELLNSQDLDIYDVAEIDSEKLLVITGWDAFHNFELLGYKPFNKVLEDLKIDSSVFDDSVFRCDHCCTWDHNDNGYTYNYRIVDDELLGLSCGCAHKAMIENLDDYIDNSDKCVESEVVDILEEKGAIEELETFIGGWTDGRGGYINGKSCREGQPESVLSEFKERYPEDSFVFVHLESGQFQSYFSIYKVLKGA